MSRRKANADLLRPVAGPLSVALAYFVAARVGQWLAFPSAPVSALWAPNAILLSGLILSSRNRWWLYLLAVLPFHVLAQAPHVPLSQVAIQYCVNCLEALLGAVAIWTLKEQPPRFDRLKSAVTLVAFAAVLAPLVTSYLMAVGFWLIGPSDDRFWLTVIARTVTNTFATLTLVPTIVHTASWLRSGRPAVARERTLELGALFACIAAVGVFVFVIPIAGPNQSPAYLFAPLPFLLWTAVRFGVLGACASVLLLGAVSTWGVLNGHGPFSEHQPVQNALSLVFFLVFTCIPLLLLAAVLEERKRVTTALRKAESLHCAVLASLHEQIAVLDRDGIVVETNESWQRHTEHDGVGAFDRALPGENYLQICSTAAQQGDRRATRLLEAVSSVLEGRETRQQIEFPVASQEGVRWFDLSIEPLRRTEGGAVVTRADITSRKRAEGEANTQRQQLAHMGRAVVLGELSGAFAHELNQPLTSILGNAEAGLRLLAQGPANPPEIVAILQDIVAEDIRAAHVIQRLRDLLTKGERQRQPVDLNAAVQETLDLTHSDLITRNVAVEVQPDLAAPLILGDRIQIQQLILNLVMNACEAMADSPIHERKLTLATHWRSAIDRVEISVADHGPGVAHERVARIFDPFVTTKKQGLGLGLAICRSIADAHGGLLSAENAPTGGAIFRFSVPLRGGAACSTPTHQLQ